MHGPILNGHHNMLIAICHLKMWDINIYLFILIAGYPLHHVTVADYCILTADLHVLLCVDDVCIGMCYYKRGGTA